MRLVRPVGTVLLLVSVAPAALGQSAVQPPDGYPAFGQPARVTVVSQGASPRTTLRYAVPKDRTERMNLDMSQTMAMNVLGQSAQVALPAMRIGADLTVTDVSASGDMTYRLVFTGVSMDGAGFDPAALAAVNDRIKSVTAVITVNNRGMVKEGKIDVTDPADPQLGQTLDSVTNTLGTLSCAFPEEAIGLGGRWEVRHAIAVSGATAFQKIDCELTAFDGKAVTLKVTTTQTAPRQPMKNPALPDVILESMTGSNAGTMTAPLNSLVPTGEVSGRATMTMGVNAGGQSQSMTMETTLKAAVSSGRK